MKTPEEWIDHCKETKLMPGEDMVLASTSDIEAIQLDAWRQGMSDAAQVALGMYEKYVNHALLAARDAKGEKK